MDGVMVRAGSRQLMSSGSLNSKWVFSFHFKNFNITSNRQYECGVIKYKVYVYEA
jgi:hypothetical protein